jgi:transposase
VDADLSSLPDDIDALKAALIAARTEAAAEKACAVAAVAELAQGRALIAHLNLEIEKLRRTIYGPRSERTARLLDQLELQLEEAEANRAEECSRLELPGGLLRTSNLHCHPGKAGGLPLTLGSCG